MGLGRNGMGVDPAPRGRGYAGVRPPATAPGQGGGLGLLAKEPGKVEGMRPPANAPCEEGESEED